MPEGSSLLARCGCRAAVFLLLAVLAGCASRPPASPELMDRCNRDYTLWARYNLSQSASDGQKLRAELALYRCKTGEYFPAIEILEDMLRRMKVPIPAPR